MKGNISESQYYSYDVYGMLTGVYSDSTERDAETNPDVIYKYDDRGYMVKRIEYSGGVPDVTTYYVRDISGNIMSEYEEDASILQTWIGIYGISRIGMADVAATGEISRYRYELKDYLGNVRATFCDDGAGGVQMLSYSDYYPFGMLQPGRTYNSSDYRFAFNGKEYDSEWTGNTGAVYDYGFRIYNPLFAKFLSIDPLTSSYPWYTPYQFAGNKPIWATDLDGKEEWIYTYDWNPEKQGYDQPIKSAGASFIIKNSGTLHIFRYKVLDSDGNDMLYVYKAGENSKGSMKNDYKYKGKSLYRRAVEFDKWLNGRPSEKNDLPAPEDTPEDPFISPMPPQTSASADDIDESSDNVIVKQKKDSMIIKYYETKKQKDIQGNTQTSTSLKTKKIANEDKKNYNTVPY
jgi:RHS repeat-associated protein